ncbi:MAG: hypothetical protein AB8G05_20050 [Oligoflexales bacterium]
MQEVADRFYAKLPKGLAICIDLPTIFRHSHLNVSIPQLSQFDNELESDGCPNYHIKTKGKAEITQVRFPDSLGLKNERGYS